MKEPKRCPVCGDDMSPCDESPIYGKSWIHPDTTCKYGRKLMFEAEVKAIQEQEMSDV